MLAYNKTTLKNLAIHGQAEEAAHHGLISSGKEKEIKQAYPVDLYTPNLFVRIGLGILTFIIVLASLGLLALISDFNDAGVMLMFSALVFYGLLEVMTARKKHFNSGVDNLLMITVIILFTASILDFLPYTVNDAVVGCLCIFLVSTYFAVRFADSLMAFTASATLLLFIFYSIATLGVRTLYFLPFIMMAASIVLYVAARKITRFKAAVYHEFSVKAVMVVALVTLYASGNYFVVRELAVEMFRYDFARHGNIPMAWFFWAFTFVMPLVYIALGISRRDLVFTRLGIVAALLAVLTFRYYYAILPVETAMLLAGALIILLAYSLVKYLRTPRYGFTFEDTNKKKVNTLNLEGVIIGEAFGNTANPEQPDTRFGGGSFGGGGAGDSY